MIKAERLTRRFGGLTAVDQVDLNVPQGSVTGFLGPNGAGKTTTMRMLCGVLTPTSGQAWINGIEVNTHPEQTRVQIGYLPESAPIYPEMRVEEYLRFRARLYHIEESVKSIPRVLDQCGLTHVRRRIIGQLSRGYRQRVALSAALLHEPKVLILDEPTAGLDPTQIDTIRSLIAELSQDRAILLSTHVLSEVEALCDSIVMIAGGRVLASGTLESLCAGDEKVCEVEIDAAGLSILRADSSRFQLVEVIEQEDGWCHCQVTAAGLSDLRPVIASTVTSGGGRLRTIESPRQPLEEVFRSLLTSDRSERDQA